MNLANAIRHAGCVFKFLCVRMVGVPTPTVLTRLRTGTYKMRKCTRKYFRILYTFTAIAITKDCRLQTDERLYDGLLSTVTHITKQAEV